MTLRSYAERIDVNENTVQMWKKAADVAVVLKHDFSELTGYMKYLSAIHAAPGVYSRQSNKTTFLRAASCCP